ncbi:hypothetical protein SLEP1_g6597 [Rubroshorea leprosula]|uniref:MULE transposase domain-containing protein n=1 Tax=Rubroshorea leprosula TaxID=152421 RepID=A0AAV5I3U0_9ROSI|nr:hypothetical protein SLEP1_g6597 [Rubroshorea leprosula]
MENDYWGILSIFHEGTFVAGPLFEYKGGICTEQAFDCDRLNVDVIMDFIVGLGYEDVMIKNVYYKGMLASMPRHLKSLAGGDSIRDIMRIVREEVICEFYVDHEVNLAEIASLAIGWIDNNVVYEDWEPQDRVGQNGNNEVNEGEEECDITQDRAIGGNKGKFGNTYERSECNNRGGYEEECSIDDWSSIDEEVDPIDGSDKDDDVAIVVKATARSLMRSTEGLEVPPGFPTPKIGVRYKTVSKKPTPRSTPTKKATYPTLTYTSKGVPTDPVEKARRRKEKAKLAEMSDNDGRDSEYAPSDVAGKLRDSSTDSKDDIFLAPRAADRPRRATNVYFNLAWEMYAITWVVVESENNDSWQWLMEKLAHDLELGDGQGYTMITDKHRVSVINAKAEVLPLIMHKYCARHLYYNLARRNRGYDIKFTFWLACRATNEFDYLDKMDALRALSEEAYAELNELLGNFWCKAFFDEHSLECLRGNEVLKRRLEGGCLPPEMRSMPRHPKRSRIKAKDEPKKSKKGKLTKLSKHGSIYTYSVCGEQGHNKARCPHKEKEEASPSQTKVPLLLHSICAMLYFIYAR